MRGDRAQKGASHYPLILARGRKAVAQLNFVAAAAISAGITTGFWHKGATVAYIGLSFAPAIVATGLAVIIGPWVWGRLAAAGGRFDLMKGALAGAFTVLMVHLVTIEIFLLAGFAMMKVTGEAQMYLDEVPLLALTAPVMSVYRFGALTLPAGMAIGGGVAWWCQRQMA